MSRTTTDLKPPAELLRTVSVAFPNANGFPDERHFQLTYQDLGIVLGDMVARDRERGGLNIDALGPAAKAARTIQAVQTDEQIEKALSRSLGRLLGILIPRRIKDRITAEVMRSVGWANAELAAEMAHMHSQRLTLQGRLRAAEGCRICGAVDKGTGILLCDTCSQPTPPPPASAGGN